VYLGSFWAIGRVIMIPQNVCCHRCCDSRWFSPQLPRAGGRYVRAVSLRNSFPAILILLLIIPSCFARVGRTCGVDALYQICLHYNLPIQYEEVYAACNPNDEGNSMYDVFQAGQELGVSAMRVRVRYTELSNLDSLATAFVKVRRTNRQICSIPDKDSHLQSRAFSKYHPSYRTI